MTTPLRICFEVACPVEHAFRIWTSRISTWWPKDHTVTGHGELSVILQNEVGGRIYERTADGREHDWGRVTRWEPPNRLSYSWHLGRDPSDATEVDIRFLPRADMATRIEIEHHGWERLGAAADQWRDQNSAGWQTLLPHFLTAITTSQTTVT